MYLAVSDVFKSLGIWGLCLIPQSHSDWDLNLEFSELKTGMGTKFHSCD